MIYEGLDQYMIRSTILPANWGYSIFNEDIKNFLKIKKINESILVSTNGFFDRLQEIGSNSKISDGIKESYMKYVLRMALRPTPYGTFSGVEIGHYGDETRILVDADENLRKITRPDMSWIYNLIRKIERDENINRYLELQCAQQIMLKGNKLINPIVLDESSDITVSITMNPLIEKIVSLCKTPYQCQKLIECIKKVYPDVEEKKIIDVIDKLLEKGILLSNLKPPLSNTNPLKYIVNILEKIPYTESYLASLAHLKKILYKYEKCKIGAGIEYYKTATKYMKNIVESNEYLQVDSRLMLKFNSISSNVKNEIVSFVNDMSKMSMAITNMNPLEEYRNRFIEFYGYNTEVPIKILLDEEMGLGVPDGYKNSMDNRKNYHNSIFP